MDRKRRPASDKSGSSARAPRIYTRTGDRGETGLIGGQRVPKDHPRVEAYGAADELNAHLGVVRALLDDAGMQQVLDDVQRRLFDLGAELATPSGQSGVPSVITPAQIDEMERIIDRYQDTLPPLREFILPGGTSLAASLHVARAVARRAERRLVALARAEPVSPDLLRYLNRLSDLLFVLARAANRRVGRPDVIWKKSD